MVESQQEQTVRSPSAQDRYVFAGRLHPERYGWPGARVETDFTFHDQPLHLTLSISWAQLAIDVVGSYSGPLLDLKNVLLNYAQNVVDAFGFVAAAGLDIEIMSCVDPAGELYIFNTAFDGLRDTGDISEDEMSMFRTLAQVGGLDFGVRAGLADVRQAIRSPLDTLFYCYRAIESIRQQYLPAYASVDDQAARKSSWAAMRAAASVEESETRWLAALATPRRHGSVSETTEDDRRRALQPARKVVLSYALNWSPPAEPQT